MTKAAMCLSCQQIIGPRSSTAESSAWTWCADPCLHTGVRWRDAATGLLEVTSLRGAGNVAVIGLHNSMFYGLMHGPHSSAYWRDMHELVTDAPGHLFDRSRRNCWAVLIRPGQSNDVFFMPYAAARVEG